MARPILVAAMQRGLSGNAPRTEPPRLVVGTNRGGGPGRGVDSNTVNPVEGTDRVPRFDRLKPAGADPRTRITDRYSLRRKDGTSRVSSPPRSGVLDGAETAASR